MDAVKYLKEKRRMLNSLGRKGGRCNGVKCIDCPLEFHNNGKDLRCFDFEAEYSEEAVARIEKWAAEHPQKTMLQDFMEKYPNAAMKPDGTPRLCPDRLGYEEDKSCIGSCIKCWNRPIEG